MVFSRENCLQNYENRWCYIAACRNWIPLSTSWRTVCYSLDQNKLKKNVHWKYKEVFRWHGSRQAPFCTAFILSIFLFPPFLFSKWILQIDKVNICFLAGLFWKGQWFLRIRNLLNSHDSRTCSHLFSGAASALAVCFAFAMLFAWLFTCSRRKGKDLVCCHMHICLEEENYLIQDWQWGFLKGMLWDRKLLYILSVSFILAWPICVHISNHLSLELKKTTVSC